MSAFLLFSLLSLNFFSTPSSSTRNPNFPVSSEIRLACKSTRFPRPCRASLSRSSLPPNPTSLDFIRSALSDTYDKLKKGQSMVKTILDTSRGDLNRTTAATNCVNILYYSDYRIRSTNDSLARGKIKDARAWMSAALGYHFGCWSALKYVNTTKLIGKTMSFLDALTKHTSNALSMMVAYDNYGKDMAEWVDVTVSKDGRGGNYKSVQEAVNAAPDNPESRRRFVIYIKEGVYEETVRVPFEKRNVVFLGDGMGKTIITGSLNVKMHGISTFNTATVGILADGFMARGLTIRNTAGPDVHQAVAFRSDSDLSVVENCEFLASMFQDCEILVAPRQLNPEKGANNAIAALGRTDPAQSTGLVFQNCLINGTDEYMRYYHSNPKLHKNYLGRPWKEFSRIVFINCVMEDLIHPDGWMPWDGDFALKTLFFGEFGNTGPGSVVSKRVAWSSQIPSQHLHTYSVQNFIQGDQWIPSSS
ncbi:putative pectinesterase/pectinesterase inhibitor 51 [Hibiscus syriacus]|uniref:pectinesterase n=1 Tax=Hibiscus syriacus TaxID=106335 RepID=A0A6A2ZZF8_HIBSY|nr:putative pectinesterase/pectinesterase inhibitor 51 [Hibiscus syriacus]